MHEHDQQTPEMPEDTERRYLNDVSLQIAASFAVNMQNEAERIANLPHLQDLSTDALAAAIMNGIRLGINNIPETNIALTLNDYRKRPKREPIEY